MKPEDFDLVSDVIACDEHAPEKNNLQYKVKIRDSVSLFCAECGKPASIWVFQYAIKESA